MNFQKVEEAERAGKIALGSVIEVGNEASSHEGCHYGANVLFLGDAPGAEHLCC
jgi:hypothetical protein